MQFIPLNDTEAAIARLGVKPGEVQFRVTKAIDKTFNSGNNGITLYLEVKDSDNNTSIIFDNLVNTRNMMWKIKHFCEATNNIEIYNQGHLTWRDCQGREGYCTIEIKKGTNGFPDKLVVSDYKCTEKEETSNEATQDDIPPFDDDLPFL